MAARGEWPPARWTRRLSDLLATHPRLGLAAKAALAASAAWVLVQLIPGPGADYPYYAPLGAVLATSTTLAGSARESAQAVSAITLGAAVALAADGLLGPNVVAIATVIAVGVLLAGWERLGSSSSWVPTSALFVLIIGHANPFHYVLGYAGLTLLGALVGVAVTAAFPPLPLTPASVQLGRLRQTLAEQLDDVVDGLQQEHPPTEDEWRGRMHAVEPVLTQMRAAVREADEARRGNRRAGRYRGTAERLYQQARALERLAFLIEDLTRLIAETEIAENEDVALGPSLRPAAARALAGLADVLRSVEGATADDEATERAYDALEQLVAALRHTRATTDEDLFAAGGIVENVRRSLASVGRPPERSDPTR
ncbi:hypothetical protein [Blastococcus sp. CCUG 61487]|uniref:FUSC family protein n=1 Tax=Blastococcus sp. CCUG 61487 TaxID=1840703 RepID=UPI0010BFCDD0|nr:hypothetical protein [Blastococcus sp. CCUG 61487]TKJ22193.1 hypothetical protein A6V29_06580 [Blastococcus sp. CCUG 61487]